MPVLKVSARYVGAAAEIAGHDGGTVARMWCPGCEDHHMVRLDAATGWTWNGDMERPTFTPSILVNGGSQDRRCHSFVTDGAWQFLTDSTHPLAGQTVPMVPIPEEYL